MKWAPKTLEPYLILCAELVDEYGEVILTPAEEAAYIFRRKSLDKGGRDGLARLKSWV